MTMWSSLILEGKSTFCSSVASLKLLDSLVTVIFRYMFGRAAIIFLIVVIAAFEKNNLFTL